MGVASRGTHVRSGVAAVASQGHSDRGPGRRALDRTGSGLEPTVVVEALRTTDAHFGHRQLGIVTPHGHVATHTGPSCGPYAADRAGDGVAVLGNLLVGPQVLDTMVDGYAGSTDRRSPSGSWSRSSPASPPGARACSTCRRRSSSRAPTPRLPAPPARPQRRRRLGRTDAITELRRLFDAFAPFVDDDADSWLDHPDVTLEQWLEQGSPTTR